LKTPPDVQVVDLCAVTSAELDDLLRREVRLWRERLLWDVSGAFAALRSIVDRGGLPGKAVRVNGRTVGYAYYRLAGRLGVIAGLAVSPDWNDTGLGEILLQQTVNDLRRQSVSRIESPFVPIDGPCLTRAFESHGFRAYWREFLRCELGRTRGPMKVPAMVSLEPWRKTDLHEAAPILQAAYDAGVEAEIHEPYRTLDGCRGVLDDILNQGGCGFPVPEASAVARYRGQGVGFVVVTEIAPRQAHLTQIAVLPDYQRRGVGRLLLDYNLRRLAELQFDTLSLIVSRSNDRALGMYQSMGFRSVLAFPVFIWER
jgi:ribosomal protein S18 acetylase RimI-like enzyme